VSTEVVYKIYGELTDGMHKHNEANPTIFINGDIVEIDETKMEWKDGEIKGDWILGMVDREYRKCWLTVIEDRTTASMEGPIRAVVKRGAIVMTDALATYVGIMERIGTTHKVINKATEGFSCVDPLSGIDVNVNKHHWTKVL